ncbi:MAG: hypothetical protein U1F08_01840 [Steroidobacteraceae bacterium]
MSDKPVDKRERIPPPEGRLGNEAGRLVTDDRGNITWEWRNDGDIVEDEEVAKDQLVGALVDPKLELARDADDVEDPRKPSTTRLQRGYNPYNSGALGKQEWKKKKDLRELGRWIELRRKLGEKPPGGG